MGKKPSKEKEQLASDSTGGCVFYLLVFSIVAHFIFTTVQTHYLLEINSRNVVYRKAVVEEKYYRHRSGKYSFSEGYVLCLKYDYAGKTYKHQIYVRQSDYYQIEIGDSTGIKYNITHPGIIISEIQSDPLLALVARY